jgi:hypothetical protein
MRCIPRPYSGLGRQSWTPACVGRLDRKIEGKNREKKDEGEGCSVVTGERGIGGNGGDKKRGRMRREGEAE